MTEYISYGNCGKMSIIKILQTKTLKQESSFKKKKKKVKHIRKRTNRTSRNKDTALKSKKSAQLHKLRLPGF